LVENKGNYLNLRRLREGYGVEKFPGIHKDRLLEKFSTCFPLRPHTQSTRLGHGECDSSLR
jgi:hypothetical protein